MQTHLDEVCLAGWQEGDRTMVPDPVKSKSYTNLKKERDRYTRPNLCDI